MTATCLLSDPIVKEICRTLRGDDVDWVKLLEQFSITEIITAIRFHGVAPLLAQQLRSDNELNKDNHLPSELATDIYALARANIPVEEYLRNHWLVILKELTRRNIHAILLKGMALSHSIYQYSFLRPKTDIDILIPEADIGVFNKRLLELGYQRTLDIEGVYTGHYQYCYTKPINTEFSLRLDVHWRLSHHLLFHNRFPYSQLIRHTQTLPRLCAETIGLNNDYALLHAAVHFYAHHYGEGRLIWVRDVHELLVTMPDQQIVKSLAIAEELGCLSLLLDLIDLSEKCFATAFNKTLIQQSDLSATAAREQSAYLIRPNLSILQRFWHQLRVLPSVRNRLTYIWELCFPGKLYMQQRYSNIAGVRLPFLYFRRICNGVYKSIFS